MKFFRYNNDSGALELNDEGILVVAEYKALLNPERNKTKTDKTGHLKERAFREYTYIYLALD